MHSWSSTVSLPAPNYNAKTTTYFALSVVRAEDLSVATRELPVATRELPAVGGVPKGAQIKNGALTVGAIFVRSLLVFCEFVPPRRVRGERSSAHSQLRQDPGALSATDGAVPPQSLHVRRSDQSQER